MKKLLLILFVLFSYAATAQEASLLSLKEIGGDGVTEIGSQAIKTPDGGFIIAISDNSDSGTGNIGSLCNIGGNRGIFIKYNSDASVLEWSKCYLGGDSDFGYIFPLSGDNFVLGGLGNEYSYTFLIHKENATGEVLWSKSYGDSASAIIRSMIATSDGGYIILGETNYTNVDFPVHYGSFMNSDFAVIKVDSNGNKLWSEVIGGTGNQMAAAVIAGPGGGCYIVGTTTSDDNDCTGNHGDSSGSSDAYLARLDSNGNILWHKDLGGSGYDKGNAGWPDGKGGIIVGASSGSHDGDVTHQVNYNGNNMWALDVDSSGNILWNNSYGGGGDEFTHSICRATDGSIWIGGDNDYRDSFEVDTFYGGGYDAWFVHTDSMGNFLNEKVLGSSGQDEGEMVYPLSNGNVVAGGYYEYGNGSFNESWGAFAAFLAILSPSTESVTQIQASNNAVKIYPNPSNDYITIESKDNGPLIITNVIGEIMYRSTIDNKIQIQVSGWPRGVYYVQVISENGFRYVQKLIVA